MHVFLEGNIPLPSLLVPGEEIGPGDSPLHEGEQHPVLATAGEAPEQYAAVLRLADAQVGGVPVVVRGAERQVFAPAVRAA